MSMVFDLIDLVQWDRGFANQRDYARRWAVSSVAVGRTLPLSGRQGALGGVAQR